MVINPVFSPTKPRSLVIKPGETVRLGFLFTGPDGEPRDTDAFPSVSIIVISPVTLRQLQCFPFAYGYTNY